MVDFDRLLNRIFFRIWFSLVLTNVICLREILLWYLALPYSVQNYLLLLHSLLAKSQGKGHALKKSNNHSTKDKLASRIKELVFNGRPKCIVHKGKLYFKNNSKAYFYKPLWFKIMLTSISLIEPR